jgi:hypothetical protein
MTRGAFLKFLLLSQSNIRRFVLLNLILLIPLSGLVYSLFWLIPQGIRYLDSFNVTVEWLREGYDSLALSIVTGDEDRIYLFSRKDFNGIRRHLFSDDAQGHRALEAASLGYTTLNLFGESHTIMGKDGNPLARVNVEAVKENVIQVLFFRRARIHERSDMLFHLLLFTASFVLLFGSLGGVSDYTQRVVFHEMKSFGYLVKAIRRFFWRSLLVSIFLTVVVGAIGTNIYFYIFIISNDLSVFIAAINFWMLVFFIFILYWVYPLLILNRDESIWRVMKKSLFVSFDNFEFTIDCLIFLLIMLIFSCVTLFILPGITGSFSFMNSALKDVSYRYTQADTA